MKAGTYKKKGTEMSSFVENHQEVKIVLLSPIVTSKQLPQDSLVAFPHRKGA